MEDYIEMIYRIKKRYLKVSEIAFYLNVKTSSASKMLDKLKDENLINREKYGLVSLTEKGYELGEYLLYRHNLLCTFLEKINNKNNLYLVEQIEHFFDKNTISSIDNFLNNMED